MTDIEIDRQLALAIGWKPSHLEVISGRLYCHEFGWGLRRFSHKDPAVIWPIAERFDAFPMRCHDGAWIAVAGAANSDYCVTHHHPATAVALAVIEAHK
jgi:hypothetical protein